MYRLLETKNGDIGQDSESSKRTTTSMPLDPASIDPLYRSRLKKQGKPQQTLAMSDKNEVKLPTRLGQLLLAVYVILLKLCNFIKTIINLPYSCWYHYACTCFCTVQDSTLSYLSEL